MQTEPQQTNGFLGSLFDFTFSQFITIRLARVIYFLGLMAVGIGAVGILSAGFSRGVLAGLLSTVLAALVFLLGAMYLRVTLEVLIVVFRIAENVEKLVGHAPTTDV